MRHYRSGCPARLAIAILTGALVAAVVPAAAPATARPAPTRSALLPPGSPEFSLALENERRQHERSLAGLGDVNGDGLADFAVGTEQLSTGAGNHHGTVYVVYGRRDGRRPPLDDLGDGGFRIHGPRAIVPAAKYSSGGLLVARAGDVNGDGLNDVLVGASRTSLPGRRAAGAAFVVFGRPGSAPVELDALGERGFRIAGAAAGDRAGSRVAGAGDVNRDGRADLLIATRSAYGVGLVFGSPTSEDVDLAELGGRGARLVPPEIPSGDDGGWFEGYAVGSAGDTNGDGLDDVVVGAPVRRRQSVRFQRFSNEAYVVFGAPLRGTVRLEAPGSGGWTVSDPWDVGSDVGAAGTAGDFDGDGLDDIVFGGSFKDPLLVRGGRRPGSRVSPVRDRGGVVRLEAGGPDASVGPTSVVPAGDLNRDGRDDLLLGNPLGRRGCRADTGEVIVVYGRPGERPIDLERLGSGGFRLDGLAHADRAGTEVAALGDFDGDGNPDVATTIPRRLFAQGTERRWSVALLPAAPPPLRFWREARPGACLRVEALTLSRRDLLRTHRLRVRVTVRALIPARERRTASPPFVALAVTRARTFFFFFGFELITTEQQHTYEPRFRRPGSKLASIALDRELLKDLRGPEPPRRLEVHAAVSDGAGEAHAVVRLRP